MRTYTSLQCMVYSTCKSFCMTHVWPWHFPSSCEAKTCKYGNRTVINRSDGAFKRVFILLILREKQIQGWLGATLPVHPVASIPFASVLTVISRLSSFYRVPAKSFFLFLFVLYCRKVTDWFTKLFQNECPSLKNNELKHAEKKHTKWDWILTNVVHKRDL